MKHLCLLAVPFSLILCPAAFADDLPSAKDPASETEAVIPENNHADLKSKKLENKFEVSMIMRACLNEHNNDKKLCSRNAMAECMKSMSKADCRKAVKRAKK